MRRQIEADVVKGVGPVIIASHTGNALVRAILAENPEAQCLDRGSYMRILAPKKCRVTKKMIEEEVGHEFNFARDLEPIMPSFSGVLNLSNESVTWEEGKNP